MSLDWNEKTLNAFFENTRKTILNLDRRIKEVNERTKTSFEVNEDAIRGIVEKYVGDGDDTLSKNMSKFEQTAEAIRTEVTRVQKSAISSVRQEYYLSGSPSMLTGGAWQASPPEWQDGKYIWVRSVITQANGEITYDSPVCITGNTGESGVGDGIQSYTAYYKLGSSATEKPESPSESWSTTPPEVTTDTYLWVSYLVTYTSGKTEWTEPYCATDAIARGDIKTLSSKIEQLAGSIKLEVTDGSESGTASIVLTVDGKEAGRGTIDMTGIAIFNSFLNDSKTMIDGGKIETDTLFARDIKATGSFQVNNGVYAIEQNTNGVTLKNVQEDSTQVSSVTLSNGAMNLQSLLITLMAYYRGQTGKIVVDYGAVSILAKSDGQWTDAYSYGIDVNDLGINMTHCPSISETTVFRKSNTSGVSLSSGSWNNLISLTLEPGTYIIHGELRIRSNGNIFTTRILIGTSEEATGSRNSVYCAGDDLYSTQSTAIVTLASSKTVYLSAYSRTTTSAATAFIEAIKLYN